MPSHAHTYTQTHTPIGRHCCTVARKFNECHHAHTHTHTHTHSYTAIAARLPGRSMNAIKNRFYTVVRNIDGRNQVCVWMCGCMDEVCVWVYGCVFVCNHGDASTQTHPFIRVSSYVYTHPHTHTHPHIQNHDAEDFKAQLIHPPTHPHTHTESRS